MSSYKSIIRKEHAKSNRDSFHISGNIHGSEEEFANNYKREKITEIDQEIEEYRKRQLENVKREMENLRENETEKLKEEIKKSIEKEFYDQLENDYQTKMEQAKSRYYEANHYYNEELTRIERAKENWVQQHKNEIVDTLELSLKKIIHRELDVPINVIQKTLEESISEINDQTQTAKMYLHPKTKQAIEENGFGDNEFVHLFADPSLELYDHLIETETEWINGKVEDQIKQLKTILTDWMNKNELI